MSCNCSLCRADKIRLKKVPKVKPISISWLRKNGYPKIGKLISNDKDNVMVYAYGAHKVIRIFTSNYVGTMQEDHDLALALIRNPVQGSPKVYSSSLIGTSHVVVMRKYTRFPVKQYTRTDMFYEARNNGPRYVDGKIKTYDVKWDIHYGNIGYWSKDPKKSVVTFDIWRAVG